MSWLITPFMIGVAGSLHCIIMCVPLMSAIPFSSPNALFEFKLRFSYQLGRILTYLVIGAIFYSFGRGFNLLHIQYSLSILIGIVLLYYAFRQWFKINLGDNLITRWVLKNSSSGVFAKLMRQKNTGGRFLLGMMNGLLPCGLVYSAAIASVIKPTIYESTLFMFFFGLGTLPAILVAWLGVKNLKLRLTGWTNYFTPVLLGFLGILLILRGMDLGIPYISPVVNFTFGEIQSCN